MIFFRVAGITPYLESIEPNQAQLGIFSLFIDITGYGTNFIVDETTVNFGDGVQVISVVVNDASHLSVEIRVSITAEPGVRDVIVTTPTKAYIFETGFEILDE